MNEDRRSLLKQAIRLTRTVVLAVLLAIVIGIALCFLWPVPPSDGPVPIYAYYCWLAGQHESEYEELNAQTLAELPVYPGAQAIYVLQVESVGFDPFAYTLSPPSLSAYYGIEDAVPEQKILSYFSISLGEDGWQRIHDDSGMFTRENHCIFIMDHSGENPGNYVPDVVPDEYRNKLEQYSTVYEAIISANGDAIDGLVFPEWIYQPCSSSE
jgi:hypothetical protein